MKSVYLVFLTYFFIETSTLPLNYNNNEISTTTEVLNQYEEKVAYLSRLINDNESEVHISNNRSTIEDLRFSDVDSIVGSSSGLGRYSIRPGMSVSRYEIEIDPNKGAGTFNGRARITVSILQSTREDPIKFYVEGLDIRSVTFSLAGGSLFENADYNIDDGIMEIDSREVTLYTFIIEYTASLHMFGSGLFLGSHGDIDYMAMNLHATNARRVFPCMDEPTESSTVFFTFLNMEYNTIVSNSLLMENSQNQFRPLIGPVHLWGMVAHNFQTVVSIPNANVYLYARSLRTNQENQAAVALSNYYRAFIDWTEKEYLEIVLDQTDSLNIFALPDVSKDWYGLSTVCIWEPYIMMELNSSFKQRKIALIAIAEALSRQWFGHVIYPENWRYQWIINGLGTYAAFEVVKEFQSNPIGSDDSLIDMDIIFVSEVIQESLYYDAYTSAPLLEPADDIFEEEDIRYNLNGLLKTKAPAILWMLRLMMGDASQDFIRSGARALLNQRSLQTVNSFNFFDSVNSEYLSSGNGLIELEDFFEPWLSVTGYPVVHVELRVSGGVRLSQERFAYSSVPQASYMIPITYTTSRNPDFENIYPIMITDGSTSLDFYLDEDDWVLFNIKGQGYYRVNYGEALWERIIEALQDPDRREEIHPLNRATLLDDALNLARAGQIGYDIAFEVVLTMEHEIHYAVWKAFIRNMGYLMKNFEALIDDDEDLDPDIYLRMIRKTIGLFESEIGFYPDPGVNEPAMTALTRGLVMEHACHARYQPCVAAAIDWFYDPDNNGVVNPNIPYEIRPAVYCTMVREGDDDVIKALYERLEIEPSMYERVVILEALACSRDGNFITSLLEETITNNSPYNAEERSKIFAAVARASHSNTQRALNFMERNVNSIRNMYGGPEKLEQAIFALAENMVGDSLGGDFTGFVTSTLSNLDDSEGVAQKAGERVREDINWWRTGRLLDAYDWIDENDASTIFLSTFLISLSLLITFFNY